MSTVMKAADTLKLRACMVALDKAILKKDLVKLKEKGIKFGEFVDKLEAKYGDNIIECEVPDGFFDAFSPKARSIAFLGFMENFTDHIDDFLREADGH